MLKQQLFTQFMAHAQGTPNDAPLAQMLATLYSGRSLMPAYLGLRDTDFEGMITRHFPQVSLPELPLNSPEMRAQRLPERQDLSDLLLSCRLDADVVRDWIADIISAGCMGDNHLWQDLGVFSRAELSVLMTHNFPKLAARNDNNMKWKKFLYRQLCHQAGAYLCRSPTCEKCVDYLDCFGSEDK
jgi:nitrogen fixation protein NifQ